jgi:hypothetical protein
MVSGVNTKYNNEIPKKMLSNPESDGSDTILGYYGPMDGHLVYNCLVAKHTLRLQRMIQ